jgi:hypothetical protein
LQGFFAINPKECPVGIVKEYSIEWGVAVSRDIANAE